jgi:hypothetical protein
MALQSPLAETPVQRVWYKEGQMRIARAV